MAIISIPPLVQYVLPADDAQGIAIDSEITIRFIDSVKPGSGHIIISNGQGDTRRIAIHDASQVQFGTTLDSKYGSPSRTLTIKPQQNLLSNSGYFVQLDAGAITSFSDAPLAAVSDTSTYNFTTSNDTSAPIPLNAEYTLRPTLTDHPIIAATFNEPVKIGPGEVMVTDRQGDTRQMFLTGADNNRVNLVTRSRLLPDTQYFLTAEPDSILDLAGNAFAGVSASNPFTFKTDKCEDTKAPALNALSMVPVGNSQASIGTDIELAFFEPVKIGSGTITLSNGQGDVRKISVLDNSQVALKANDPLGDLVNYAHTLTINPTQHLLPNSQYVVQADPGIVTDVCGNHFAGLLDESYMFNTAGLDTTPPTPVSATLTYSYTKDVQSIHIPVSTGYSAYFDEYIKAGAGNFIISNGQGDTQIISANDTKQVNISFEYLHITPSKKLLPGNRYFLQVDHGAITDLADNAYAGVQDKAAFTFTTEALWAAVQNPVVEVNKGNSVGLYENKDILVFHFNAPISRYKSFKLSAHSFGGNDVVLSQDGLFASVELTAESTVQPGDVLTLEGATTGKADENDFTPTADIEFTL
ncbi:MAG: Ig-like domain-containing protein [Methylococcales bacterium]